MVSSGTVSGDSNSISSIISSYTSTISELSNSWKGYSRDQIISQAEEFASSFQSTITSQMSSFANAINLYNQYIEAKQALTASQNGYNQAVANNDQSSANQYYSYVTEYQSRVQTLKTQINQSLQSASSTKLEATPISGTVSARGGVNPASSDFVNYYQYNYSQPYSQGTIKTSGCGPTSLAMVLTNLTGREITPVETAAKGNGRYTCSKGTYWSYFGDMAQEYGVNCEQMGASSSNIVNQLNEGKTLILSMGPGHFTKGGHFIVVRGIDSNGQLIVSDPASETRSNQTWDVNLVSSEAKQLWAMSA